MPSIFPSPRLAKMKSKEEKEKVRLGYVEVKRRMKSIINALYLTHNCHYELIGHVQYGECCCVWQAHDEFVCQNVSNQNGGGQLMCKNALFGAYGKWKIIITG